MHSAAKQILGIVAVVVALYFIIDYAHARRPSYWQEENLLNAKLGEMHGGNTAKLEDETKPKLMKQWVKNVDVDNFTNAILPSATRSAKLDTAHDAWLQRATRTVPMLRNDCVTPNGYHLPCVMGNQGSWQEHFTASEPLLVIVSKYDRLCTTRMQTECAHADGIYRDGTPDYHFGANTVLQDRELGGDPGNAPGSYRALLSRECIGGACGPAHETGFIFAACPADGRSTTFLLRTNDYTLVGPVRNNQDTATGRITYNITHGDPQAVAACRANPEAAFVSIPDPDANK